MWAQNSCVDGVVGNMVPALASKSDFVHQYLRKDHIMEQNTFYKNVKILFLTLVTL